MNQTEEKYPLAKRIAFIVLLIFVFLFSIELMGKSFGSLGKEVAESILLATSNPFIGLFIGLLVTALIQSSSTITTMTVAMVASGALSLPEAVPIIMGANIGTTLTSTIVSLGYINKREEFQRAISAGTVHDIFNILTVAILFPLEYHYRIISWMAQEISGWIASGDGEKVAEFKLFDLLPGTDYVIHFIDNPFISIALSFILLFGSIKIIASYISRILVGEDQDKLNVFIFEKRYTSFGWGILLTAAVQSSSVTTSLIVPFAATGKIRLDRVMPFILGANIGTTITAIIAVLFKSQFVVSIALTHLIINVIGVLIFLPIPFMSRLLIYLAGKFGDLTLKSRLLGFLYIIIMFFLLPFTLIYSNRDMAEIKELTYEIETEQGKTTSLIIAKIDKNLNLPGWMVSNDQSGINPNIQTIYRNKNILFIDNSFFIINSPESCWDDDSGMEKSRICVEEILPSYQTGSGLSFDSVYLYRKNFYNPSVMDSSYFQYYISVPSKLLLRKEKLDKNDRVVRSETLISITE